MKIAFVYDRVNKIGGAERVLESLHKIWPDAPLFTAVYNPETAPWANKFKIIPSFANRIPFAKSHHELFPIVMPYAFESLDLSEFDVVLSVTSAEAKGIITNPNQLHVCYLLTPTRYLWSHTDQYAGHGFKRSFRQFFMANLRAWDTVAASRPDKMISISKFVDERCQKYYHRKSDAIIYPPVETKQFYKKNVLDYFLVVSRLVPYKRVDLAIMACNQLEEKLMIVGSGSELANLKKIAGPTITFVGQISDEELLNYYSHAKALIFPQEEEFGITAVEAQSAGIPIVAFRGGSANEIITDTTGILFDHQRVNDLTKALSLLKYHTWYDKTIQEHARIYDEKVFQQKIRQFVEESWLKFCTNE
jgi:glycosyltransferase involved in cell wall biosynthesis